MKKKIFLLIFFLLISPIFLCGCYDATGVDKLAYVVAIGIESGDENLLKLTLQIATPTSGDKGSSEQSSQTTITSVDCSSIESGISLVNSNISKKINLYHCKIAVISEELAANGIKECIETLANNIEMRPDCDIIISRCSAKSYIEHSKPTLTDISARYYESLINSKDYTGYTATSPLWQVFSNINNSSCESVIVLGGLTVQNSKKDDFDNLNLIDTDTNYIADQTPIETSTGIQDMGLAVFKDDKLIGELTAIETICYLIFTNGLSTCTVSIPSPFKNEDTITLTISFKKRTRNDVKLINNSPYIKSNINLKANISSIGVKTDYSDSKSLDLIEQYAESYIKSHLIDYVYKTAKDFGCDINKFGNVSRMHYFTIKDWEEIKWDELYKDSFFDINVNVDITSSYLFMKH